MVANEVEWGFAILKRVEDGVTSDSLLWQWCSRHAQSTVCQPEVTTQPHSNHCFRHDGSLSTQFCSHDGAVSPCPPTLLINSSAVAHNQTNQGRYHPSPKHRQILAAPSSTESVCKPSTVICSHRCTPAVTIKEPKNTSKHLPTMAAPNFKQHHRPLGDCHTQHAGTCS